MVGYFFTYLNLKVVIFCYSSGPNDGCIGCLCRGRSGFAVFEVPGAMRLVGQFGFHAAYWWK